MKLKQHTLVLGAAGGVIALAAAVAVSVRASGAAQPPEAPKPALTVTVERPQPAELPLRIDAHGSVAAWQEAVVGAEIAGLRIAAVEVNVGDTVHRGQVLARFATDTTRADLAQLKASLAEADAHAAEAAANAQRARTLAASGALSDQQIQQYLTVEQTARARVDAQRAAVQAQAVRLAQTQVLASDDGVISARAATVGAVASPGQELFRLIRGGRLEWRAEVTANELVTLRPGTLARLVGADGQSIEARVRMVAPTVDPHTRLGLVYVDLPKAAGVKSGMFAKGEFELGRSTALTVPQQALVVRDGFSYVFRLTDDQRVVQVRVTTGRRNGQRVEVVDGLAPGTPLVAGGAGFLNDGDLVKVAQAQKPQLLADAGR
jgi:HlyD family secretion protein